MPATVSKRRKNTITKFLQDIVDDSKDLVDDLIERAQDAEDNVRDAIVDVVDDNDDEVTDVAELQKALAELSAKVDRLAKVK
jgi:hypothetical protein